MVDMHVCKGKDCVVCYRELAAERGQRILELTRENARQKERIAQLEREQPLRVGECA